MPPLAYHITWHTYGTWLPGDERGWVEKGEGGIQAADAERHVESRDRMNEAAVTLDVAQREIVEATIRAHCEIRGWGLHAVSARTTHVHAVVTASVHPDTVMDQFKAWCSRRLNERGPRRTVWWVRHGSTKWINHEKYLREAIEYVLERQ